MTVTGEDKKRYRILFVIAMQETKKHTDIILSAQFFLKYVHRLVICCNCSHERPIFFILVELISE